MAADKEDQFVCIHKGAFLKDDGFMTKPKNEPFALTRVDDRKKQISAPGKPTRPFFLYIMSMLQLFGLGLSFYLNWRYTGNVIQDPRSNVLVYY